MSSYCSKCGKNTESENPNIVKTKNGRIMLLTKCALCNSKKSKFIKEQETRGLFRNLMGIKIPILSDTAKKMEFSIKDFFSKCDQICRKLRTWSHFLKKSLMENFIFCEVWFTHNKYFILKVYNEYNRK